MSENSAEQVQELLHKFGMLVQKKFVSVFKNTLNPMGAWQTAKRFHCSRFYVTELFVLKEFDHTSTDIVKFVLRWLCNKRKVALPRNLHLTCMMLEM